MNYPLVDDWIIFGKVLLGNVYNDSRHPDGEHIITSNIQNVCLRDNTVKTKNTTYQLGKVDKDFLNFIREDYGDVEKWELSLNETLKKENNNE